MLGPTFTSLLKSNSETIQTDQWTKYVWYIHPYPRDPTANDWLRQGVRRFASAMAYLSIPWLFALWIPSFTSLITGLGGLTLLSILLLTFVKWTIAQFAISLIPLPRTHFSKSFEEELMLLSTIFFHIAHDAGWLNPLFVTTAQNPSLIE